VINIDVTKASTYPTRGTEEASEDDNRLEVHS